MSPVDRTKAIQSDEFCASQLEVAASYIRKGDVGEGLALVRELQNCISIKEASRTSPVMRRGNNGV